MWNSWFPSLAFDTQFDILSLFNGRSEYQYRRIDPRKHLVERSRRSLGQSEAIRKLERFANDLHRYMEQLPLTFDHYQRLIEMMAIIMSPFLGSSYGQIALKPGQQHYDEHYESAKRIMSLRKMVINYVRIIQYDFFFNKKFCIVYNL